MSKNKAIGAIVFLTILAIIFNRNDYFMVEGIKAFIVWFVFLTHIVIILYLISSFTIKKHYSKIRNWLKQNAVSISLGVAASAMLGSLFYSNIALMYPCDLCWYQRILIYPLTFIFWVAHLKKENPRIYALPLAITGGIIALYHYVTQFVTIATSCSPFETGVACSVKLVHHFGYITIPLMAVTACGIIIYLMRITKTKQK